MGTGSNKHVVGLDAVKSLFSSSCPIVVKHCSISLGAMNEAEVLDAVESTFVIVFLMLSILSVNKFIKSLLLNCEEICSLGGVWLFVNLATVLNKNLGLFWLLSMSLRICSVLAAFRACHTGHIAGHTVFPGNSKDFQVSFSPFALKITRFFLERMGINVVPWRSTFFSNLF